MDTKAIRDRIEAKHKRALAALAEIEEYLGEESPKPPDEQPEKRLSNRLSNRDRVFEYITVWATAQDVADQTGLDIKQVRGVVNAPGLIDVIEKRESSTGTVEYRLKPKSPS
jgi:hypothetical protein